MSGWSAWKWVDDLLERFDKQGSNSVASDLENSRIVGNIGLDK